MSLYPWEGTSSKSAPRMSGNWDLMNYAIVLLVGMMRTVGIDHYSQRYKGYEISIVKQADNEAAEAEK